MDELHLRSFIEVADKLSFRKAAESLHMSRSPLSRRVRELETELGAALFDRDSRHVRLTAAGSEALPLAIEIVEGMARLARRIDHISRRVRSLRVGFRPVPQRFRSHLLSVLQPNDEYPAVHPEPIEQSQQLRQLLAGTLDLAVAQLSPGDRRFTSWPLLTEHLAVVLPDEPRFRELDVVYPEHLERLSIVNTSSAAANDRFAVPVPDFQAYRDVALGITPGGHLLPGGVQSMIADGAHCAFMVRSPASPWYASLVGDGVIVRPLPDDFPPLVTHLIYLTDRAHDDDIAPAVARVVEAFPKPWGEDGPPTTPG